VRRRACHTSGVLTKPCRRAWRGAAADSPLGAPLIAGSAMLAVLAAVALFVVSPWGDVARPFVASPAVAAGGWLVALVAASWVAAVVVAVARWRAPGRP
jgi:hypothetical protein